MANVNFGKRFEDDFKSSLPDYCLIHRLRDSGQSFTNYAERSDNNYSWKNECDFIFFDDRHRIEYSVENKTTKFKTMNWESKEEYETNKRLGKKSTKLIKWHQINSLIKFDRFNYAVPCFFLNFRNDDTNAQRTYFIHINDFVKMIKTLNKKSFDEIDLINNGAIKINGLKKRTRYAWDINEFLSKYSLNFCNDN